MMTPYGVSARGRTARNLAALGLETIGFPAATAKDIARRLPVYLAKSVVREAARLDNERDQAEAILAAAVAWCKGSAQADWDDVAEDNFLLVDLFGATEAYINATERKAAP